MFIHLQHFLIRRFWLNKLKILKGLYWGWKNIQIRRKFIFIGKIVFVFAQFLLAETILKSDRSV